jgi:glycosyltransferase involved in cell wall biosynthesis
MNPPRILHLISRLDGYGGARAIRAVTARQAESGQRVTVAAFAADPEIADELRAAGVDVHSIRRRWTLDPIALGRLIQLRRSDATALTHAWDPAAHVYARLLGSGSPIVAAWTATLNDMPPFVGRLTPPHVRLDPGVAPGPPRRQDRSRFLDELRLSTDVRAIAVAGRLERRKELDEAIWCFELVRVLHPAARLLVFGDGPDRERLERYAELVSEPGCVVFPGYRRDLLDLLPNVDVFWQLDRASVTPHALLEAMAAGVPVVASDVSAHRAAVSSGENGFLTARRSRAEVARVTDQLLGDANLAQRVGAAAALAVQQRWSIEECVAACERLYRST